MSPVLDNLVCGEDPMVNNQLFYTKPLTLVEKDPCSCKPRQSCHRSGCPVLDDLKCMEKAPISSSPKLHQVAEFGHEDSIGHREPGGEGGPGCHHQQPIHSTGQLVAQGLITTKDVFLPLQILRHVAPSSFAVLVGAMVCWSAWRVTSSLLFAVALVPMTIS